MDQQSQVMSSVGMSAQASSLRSTVALRENSRIQVLSRERNTPTKFVLKIRLVMARGQMLLWLLQALFLTK
jgi:hypothetical protein